MRHVPQAEERRGRRRPASYYGVPPIHKPHWKWLIIWYFFLGGLSAGSYVVAMAAELFGDRDDRDTVRVGRYLALLAAIPCPILLTLDLGRPERFYKMFRVLKLRSLVYAVAAPLSSLLAMFEEVSSPPRPARFERSSR